MFYFLIAACGDTILTVTNQTKIFTSPNYQLSYEINVLCTWILNIEPSNPVIMLRFTDLNLEDTKECSSNYLEISYMPVNKITILKLEWLEVICIQIHFINV